MSLRIQPLRLTYTLLAYVLISGTSAGCSFKKLTIDEFKSEPAVVPIGQTNQTTNGASFNPSAQAEEVK